MWHPNISEIGTVCMNVISVDWKESTTLIDLTEAVRALLSMPNPDSPLNAEAAHMMTSNEEFYRNNSILWTKVYASGKYYHHRFVTSAMHAQPIAFCLFCRKTSHSCVGRKSCNSCGSWAEHGPSHPTWDQCFVGHGEAVEGL